MAGALADATAFELGLILAEAVTLVLGIAISVIAYRGYRRNASRPMLFIAVGFVLVVGIPGVLGGTYLVTGAAGAAISVVVQISEVLGMLSILYAIRMAR